MGRFWNLMPDAERPADGVLDIEGPIAADEFWGNEVTPRNFKKALAGMGNITVHINSPGGDVMAGAEIYSALLEHRLNGRGRVTVIVTALAASAASIIAMAGDEILVSPVAYMMIHNPWSIAMGDSHDMRKEAKILDEIREGLITAYQRKTGLERDELRRMLDSETWMSATTCVEKGFADGIYGGEIRAAAAAGSGMMTRATSEAIAEMCARWKASRGEAEAETDDPEEENPETDDPEEENPETDDPEEETEARAEAEPEEPEEDGDNPDDPEEADARAEAEPEDPEEDGDHPDDPEETEARAEAEAEEPEEEPDGEPDGEDPEDPDGDDPEEEPEETEQETENSRRAEIARWAENAWREAIRDWAGEAAEKGGRE